MEEVTKYYFISYKYGSRDKDSYNSLTTRHPLQLQNDWNANYPGLFVLTSWQEIDAITYEKYQDKIIVL